MSLFGRIPTGPEAFLEPPGVSGQQPYSRTHLKSLVPNSSVCWDVRKYRRNTDVATPFIGCILVPVAVGQGRLTWILESLHSCWVHQNRDPRVSVACLLRLYPSLEGLGLLPGSWGPIFMEMPTGSEEFLCLSGVSGLRPCVWIHLKKGLAPPSSGWRDVHQIPTQHTRLSVGIANAPARLQSPQVTLQSAKILFYF